MKLSRYAVKNSSLTLHSLGMASIIGYFRAYFFSVLDFLSHYLGWELIGNKGKKKEIQPLRRKGEKDCNLSSSGTISGGRSKIFICFLALFFFKTSLLLLTDPPSMNNCSFSVI